MIFKSTLVLDYSVFVLNTAAFATRSFFKNYCQFITLHEKIYLMSKSKHVFKNLIFKIYRFLIQFTPEYICIILYRSNSNRPNKQIPAHQYLVRNLYKQRLQFVRIALYRNRPTMLFCVTAEACNVHTVRFNCVKSKLQKFSTD